MELLPSSSNAEGIPPASANMPAPESIATWNVLKEFGFKPDVDVWSDISPGLSFEFDKNCKLSASAVMGQQFALVVLFTGFARTRDTFAPIQFELPRTLAPRELCAALLVYHLDQAAGGVFKPARNVGWIAEGRQSRHLLPWEIDKAAYEARPHCSVDREWWRPAVKKLADIFANAPDDAPVVIAFDGSILTISCMGNVVPLPAEGKPWLQRYSISASVLRARPRRLMRARVEISIWKAHLHFGGWRYGGVTEAGISGPV